MKPKTLGIVTLLIFGCNKVTTIDGDISENGDKAFDQSLDGIWTDDSLAKDKYFEIKNDSMHGGKYYMTAKLEMHGDSVTIYFQGDTYKAKMYKTHADTLVYEFKGVKTKHWQAKNL